jgi:crotonobetainyl-CoA:carnitine CoA-transferase CaiB-like acyl-CoA transferase
VLANQAMNYLTSGVPPHRMGNAHPNIVPYQEFAVSDGSVIVAVGNDGQFRQFAGAIGAPLLADDPLFATNEARVINRGVLVPRIAALVMPFRRDMLLALLEKAGVPAGPINTVADVFADPQVIHRDMRIDLQRDAGGAVPSVRTPILMDGSPLVYERASPRLGEHTATILTDLGYGEDEVTRLKRVGVTG